jgi:hypothetical protein
VQLVDYYVSRHRDSLAMVDMVLAYGADPRVHDLAQRMKSAMTRDLELMRARDIGELEALRKTF